MSKIKLKSIITESMSDEDVRWWTSDIQRTANELEEFVLGVQKIDLSKWIKKNSSMKIRRTLDAMNDVIEKLDDIIRESD